jgi:hypothetical protein
MLPRSAEPNPSIPWTAAATIPPARIVRWMAAAPRYGLQVVGPPIG